MGVRYIKRNVVYPDLLNLERGALEKGKGVIVQWHSVPGPRNRPQFESETNHYVFNCRKALEK